MPRRFEQASPIDRSALPRRRRIGLAVAAVAFLAMVIGTNVASPGSNAGLASRVAPGDTAATVTSGPASTQPLSPSPASPSLPAVASPSAPQPAADRGSTTTPVDHGPFTGDLMIADRQNGRILIVDRAGTVRWRFPVHGSLPPGQGFAADDAFLAPDGKSIVANEEERQVIVRIDVATRRVVWEYGRYGVAGRPGGSSTRPTTPIRWQMDTSSSRISGTAGSSRSTRPSGSPASGAGRGCARTARRGPTAPRMAIRRSPTGGS